MIEDATINYIKGDTCSRDFTISNYEEEINKVLFTIKNNESDKRPLLQKSLIIDLDNMFDKNNFANIPNGKIEESATKIKNSYYDRKLLYVKCRPNTKYTIKMDNTDGVMRVATTTNKPAINTDINQNIDADYKATNKLRMTDGTYSSNVGSVTAVVSDNKITLNGNTTGISGNYAEVTIPLSQSLQSGKKRLCAINNGILENMKVYVTNGYVDLNNYNPACTIEIETAITELKLSITNNTAFDNYEIYLYAYDYNQIHNDNKNAEINITTNETDKYIVLQYYHACSPSQTESVTLDSISITMTTIENGITLVNYEDGVRTYNLLIDANETDNFKVDYEYYFAIKIFTYEESGDIELTPIKGTITLSARGD